MRPTRLLDITFYLTLGMVAAAIAMRFNAAPGGGDVFVLASPLFFNMAARRATKFRGAAVGLALVGVLFAAGALALALTGKR